MLQKCRFEVCCWTTVLSWHQPSFKVHTHLYFKPCCNNKERWKAMAWTYSCLICSFIGDLSKACVGISAGACQHNATEITGSPSVNSPSHTKTVTAFQIRISLEQINNFGVLCKEITRNAQKLRQAQFLRFWFFFKSCLWSFASCKFLSILLRFCWKCISADKWT